jgi:hypothetical protein
MSNLFSNYEYDFFRVLPLHKYEFMLNFIQPVNYNQKVILILFFWGNEAIASENAPALLNELFIKAFRSAFRGGNYQY